MKAFVLGAGLGTRLRPLTDWLPKPMVPVFHRPLITYAFDHLLSLSGIDGWIVNTHHYSEAYEAAFPDGSYGGLPLHFRHEPILLETAGGIANIADLLGDERFIVYNGDILADIPLAPLLEQHETAGNEVTLLLRSEGPGLHIGLGTEPGLERVADIRGMIGNPTTASYQFTGIYVVEPRFVERLTPGKKESVIPIFLQMIREGAGLGGYVEDRGHWWDLGDAETYRQVHREIPQSDFPAYDKVSNAPWHAIHPGAEIAPGATIDPGTVVGPRAEIGAGAKVERSVVWPGGVVAPGASITDAVVQGSQEAHYAYLSGQA